LATLEASAVYVAETPDARAGFYVFGIEDGGPHAV
jgi:hypothetical protein